MSTVPPCPGIGDMLCQNAVRYRDVLAYSAAGSSMTHGELAARASDLAAGLALRGVRRGDRVAVLAINSIEFGEVMAACFIAGYVAATVNYRLTPAEMAGVVADSGAAVLIVDPSCVEFVELIRGQATNVSLVVTMGESSEGCEALADVRDDGIGVDLAEFASGSDLACLIYTSGTTGKPKGCMIGQSELAFVARTMNREMRAGSEDRALIVMPMFHIGALAIVLGVHAGGGTVLLHNAFNAEKAVKTIVDDGVNILHLAPTMLDAVVGAVSGRSMSSVHTVVYSAAPITAPVLDAALAAMPAAGFVNLYGQTEVITSGLPREFHRGTTESDRVRLRSVGFPFPENEVRIVDDRGDDVGAGSSGEIIVRSPETARGYWNNSAETAETFRDGWCHTGDIGRIDSGGLLYLVDRKKDVIITGGENVASLEVENVLSAHSDVVECAVVGVRDERWGESVTAVLVVNPGARPDLADIRELGGRE